MNSIEFEFRWQLSAPPTFETPWRRRGDAVGPKQINRENARLRPLSWPGRASCRVAISADLSAGHWQRWKSFKCPAQESGTWQPEMGRKQGGSRAEEAPFFVVCFKKVFWCSVASWHR